MHLHVRCVQHPVLCCTHTHMRVCVEEMCTASVLCCTHTHTHTSTHTHTCARSDTIRTLLLFIQGRLVEPHIHPMILIQGIPSIETHALIHTHTHTQTHRSSGCVDGALMMVCYKRARTLKCDGCSVVASCVCRHTHTQTHTPSPFTLLLVRRSYIIHTRKWS